MSNHISELHELRQLEWMHTHIVNLNVRMNPIERNDRFVHFTVHHCASIKRLNGISVSMARDKDVVSVLENVKGLKVSPERLVSCDSKCMVLSFLGRKIAAVDGISLTNLELVGCQLMNLDFLFNQYAIHSVY